MTESLSYQLIFEGPKNSEPETLRRIKGAMISDLEFSISEVQEFLQDLPSIILATHNEKKVKKTLDLITAAGGIAKIIPPINSEDSNETALIFNDIEVDEEPEKEKKVYNLDISGDSPDFDLAFNDIDQDPATETQAHNSEELSIKLNSEDSTNTLLEASEAVSYTHLTLPTICSV